MQKVYVVEVGWFDTSIKDRVHSICRIYNDPNRAAEFVAIQTDTLSNEIVNELVCRGSSYGRTDSFGYDYFVSEHTLE